MAINLAREYLERARALGLQARERLEAGDVALSIARSAEVAEYALKAAILAVGGTYKPRHDVSGDLLHQENFVKFPSWFQEKVPRLSLISRVLSEIYLSARYGFEALNTTPSSLFSLTEAQAYLQNAEEVLVTCEQLLREQ